jgi:hypothetical protein
MQDGFGKSGFAGTAVSEQNYITIISNTCHSYELLKSGGKRINFNCLKGRMIQQKIGKGKEKLKKRGRHKGYAKYTISI